MKKRVILMKEILKKVRFLPQALLCLFSSTFEWKVKTMKNLLNNTYFHTIAFSEALYFALPLRQINWTPEVFNGVGIFTSIFWPRSDGLKLLFKTHLTSIFVRPTSLTRGITLNGKFISLVVRYLKEIYNNVREHYYSLKMLDY